MFSQMRENGGGNIHRRHGRVRRILCAVVGLVVCGGSVVGCVRPARQEPKRIEDIRPIPPALRVTNFTVQRRDLVSALARGVENSIRLVPVYETVSARVSYEHRAFDVRPQGVFALLGLQNSDIVVAADGYLIKRPEQFMLFVQMLAQEDEATIEIRRGGEPRLFKYTLVPARASMGEAVVAEEPGKQTGGKAAGSR
jgi:hypothetical protein